MVKIDARAWQVVVEHCRRAYPLEGCGALWGALEGADASVCHAAPLRNVYAGVQRSSYEIDLEELLVADREARELGLRLVAIFHSHPDRDAYFSEKDFQNGCPWYRYVVLSVRHGELKRACCWRLDDKGRTAVEEELVITSA